MWGSCGAVGGAAGTYGGGAVSAALAMSLAGCDGLVFLRRVGGIGRDGRSGTGRVGPAEAGSLPAVEVASACLPKALCKTTLVASSRNRRRGGLLAVATEEIVVETTSSPQDTPSGLPSSLIAAVLGFAGSACFIGMRGPWVVFVMPAAEELSMDLRLLDSEDMTRTWPARFEGRGARLPALGCCARCTPNEICEVMAQQLRPCRSGRIKLEEELEGTFLKGALVQPSGRLRGWRSRL